MTDRRNINRIIRNFLFSSVNKEFLIFLFFLALSGVFWLMMTLNENYEKEVCVPVRISGIPKNVVLTSDETDTIKVTLNDKGLVLLGYIYGEGIRTLNINFKTYARSGESVTVPASELQRLLYQQLSSSTRISAVKPDKLEFFYNYGLKKRVPVKWTGIVKPEHLYFISHVDYHPDSITVYAPKNRIDSINVVYTEPLNLTNFRDTMSVKCNLQKMRGVKLVPASARLVFFTDVLTEESISDIPIKGINMPPGKVLRTFPSKATVRFVTGVSQFRKLSAKDFEIIVDYDEIFSNPSEKCRIHLKSVPNGVSRASVNMSEVDYLIEEE